MIREEKIQKPFIAEFFNTGSQPKGPASAGTPAKDEAQTRWAQGLRRLARCSDAGDLSAWKKLLPECAVLAKDAGIDLDKNLDARVQLKQMELTLLFRASKIARQQAIFAEKKATDAQVADQGDQARLMFQRAQKFNELATYLTQQLRTKTA